MNDFRFPLRAIFLAIPLQDKALEEFQGMQNQLAKLDRSLRFQNPQSPHLTLMYWPEVGQLEYQGIVEQAKKIAAKQSPFTLQVNGVDTFGVRGRDNVLFLTVAFSPELAQAKKSCPWSDGKPFHPHITIAWIKHPEQFGVHRKEIMKELKDESFEMRADRLRLYVEIEGKKQTPLEDFPFIQTPPRPTQREL